METTALEGAVDRITYYNPENGFSVVRLRARGRREPVAVVGTLPSVQPGEWLELTGKWQTDRVHGAQFRVESATVRAPSELDDVVRYLSSGLIRQLGPVLAQRVVAAFGERTLEILDTQPLRVRDVPGIGRQRAQAIAEAWVQHRALRAVSRFLSEHGIDTRYAARLVAAYGADAPKVLGANPYRLVADVPGLGFAVADRLGRDLQVRATAPARLQAAVHAALLRAAESGHTRLDRPTLTQTAAELAGVEPDLIDASVTQLLAGEVLSWGGAEPRRGSSGHPRSGKTEGSRSARSELGLQSGEPAPAADTLWSLLPSQSRAAANERVPRPAPAPGGRLRIYEPPAPALASAPVQGIGLSGLVRAEESLARRLLELADRPCLVRAAQVDRWLESDAEARRLSAEQRAAVRGAALSRCFVITGGPGVGKTTIVRALVRCLRDLGRSVALAAPTGKAAKRLGEVVAGAGLVATESGRGADSPVRRRVAEVGADLADFAGPVQDSAAADGDLATARQDERTLEARTIHRLLGAGPKGFRHGAREPLPHDCVVVDEASMLDTQLARAVVSAIGPDGQLVLVGDADQLPSVGPGQVLRDLLASARVPSARLETVFRQAAQSLIVTNAHRIRRGELPRLVPVPRSTASAARRRSATAGELGSRRSAAAPAELERSGDADCTFLSARASQLASVAAEWAAVSVPELTGLAPSEVQVLAPLTRVCQSVNSLLQARLNPPHGQAERPHGALPLRVGDRVIQTRNNYDLGVFNGDGGTIVGIEAEELTVDFGDGRFVVYGGADAVDLEHAYCLTVHRAQGSEWPAVVVLVSSSFGQMLSRNLLYTALTRARRFAVLIGDEDAIGTAVAQVRDQNRSTGLRQLLSAEA